MAYTINLLAENGDTVEYVDADERLEPMWMAAGLDILDAQGLELGEYELQVSYALKNLQAAPDYYRDNYELVSGDFYEVESVLERLLDIAKDDPALLMEVVY